MFYDPQFWVAVSFIIFIAAIFNPVRKILISSLDSQIAEKLAMLDQAQAELDRQSSGSDSGTGMIVLVSVLSALVIGLIVVLVFMLISKPKQQMPPPWMMYPPRRPRKKR